MSVLEISFPEKRNLVDLALVVVSCLKVRLQHIVKERKKRRGGGFIFLFISEETKQEAIRNGSNGVAFYQSVTFLL